MTRNYPPCGLILMCVKSARETNPWFFGHYLDETSGETQKEDSVIP